MNTILREQTNLDVALSQGSDVRLRNPGSLSVQFGPAMRLDPTGTLYVGAVAEDAGLSDFIMTPNLRIRTSELIEDDDLDDEMELQGSVIYVRELVEV